VTFEEVGWRLIRIDPADWSWTTVGSYDSVDGNDISRNRPLIPVVTPDGAVWVPSLETPYAPSNPGLWDEGQWEGYIRYVPGGPSATVTAFQYDPYWGNDSYYPGFTQGNNNYVFIARPDGSVWFISDWDVDGWQLDPDGTTHRVPLIDEFLFCTDYIASSPSGNVSAVWASGSSGYYLWRLYDCGGGPKWAVD
jgi:hypothetical protein